MATPSIGLPPDLEEREGSESFLHACSLLESELLEPDKRPSDDGPLFTELLVAGGGVVTIPHPDGGKQCLPVFSTPFRAADYVRTHLSSGPEVQIATSSPVQLLNMLCALREAAVETFTVDRCPRCALFTVLASESMGSVADVQRVWAISKGMERVRADLYFSYALESARGGDLERARDVALETVGHVSPEDPRLHLLLGQIAVAMGDRALLQEARIFLRFFRHVPSEMKLYEVESSGTPDFAGPE